VWHVCHDGRRLSAAPLNASASRAAGAAGAAAALAAQVVRASETAGAACTAGLLRSQLEAAAGAGKRPHHGRHHKARHAPPRATAAAGDARHSCLAAGHCASPWFSALSGDDLAPGGRVAGSSQPWFVLVSASAEALRRGAGVPAATSRARPWPVRCATRPRLL
jgi:hypothetical protein